MVFRARIQEEVFHFQKTTINCTGERKYLLKINVCDNKNKTTPKPLKQVLMKIEVNKGLIY